MKKTICFIALLGALTTPVLAESSVTLFGTIDGGVTVGKYRGQAATVQLSSSNWSTTLFGIKGTEDLGGGNSIGFNLQQSFNFNDGTLVTPGTAFDYESVLTISGDWGELVLGRAGGLSSDDGDYSILGGSAFGTNFQTVGSLNSSFTLAGINSNSILYVSPEFKGLQLSLMYSNGISNDTSQWSKNDHYYGIGLTYSIGNFNADVIWEAMDNKDERLKATKLLNVGLSYDFGPFTLYGAYENTANAMQLPGQIDLSEYVSVLRRGASSNAFSVSVSAPAWGGTAMLQWQYAFGKVKDKLLTSGTDSFISWSIGAAYTYPISKRTLLYADVAYGNTGKFMKVVDDLRGWNATIGMSHNF
ncbi:MAG: porin [Burkholderiales bacterium]|nr:porin [Burkholderiales bacterium]